MLTLPNESLCTYICHGQAQKHHVGFKLTMRDITLQLQLIWA